MPLLKKFIKLMKDELVTTNSNLKPRKPSFTWVLDESKYLNLEEVCKLRKACREAKEIALKQNKLTAVRDWFMVELGLMTGLRVQEMADLKCSDLLINRKQSMLIVQSGKGGRKRAVKINSEFKKDCLWFMEWKRKAGQNTNDTAYLLTSDKGKKLTKRALQKGFKRCTRKANLPEHYSIHCLRHTHGSHLYKVSNYNLRLVQQQLGHTSIKITEVYASLMNSDVKDAVEKLYKK